MSKGTRLESFAYWEYAVLRAHKKKQLSCLNVCVLANYLNLPKIKR